MTELITRQDDPQLTHLQKQGFVDCYLRNWVNGGKYERSHSLNVGVALNQAWQLFKHYDAVRIALDAALAREATRGKLPMESDLLTQIQRLTNERFEQTSWLNAIAHALHPHKSAEHGWTYLPQQFAEMITALQAELADAREQQQRLREENEELTNRFNQLDYIVTTHVRAALAKENTL